MSAVSSGGGRAPRRSRGRWTRAGQVGVVVLGGVVIFSLTACAGAAGGNDVAHVATGHISGFWAGLWHGLIAPITLIVSLFNDHVNIYDVHNNGNWYNVGFMIGVGTILGGGGQAPRHAKRNSG